MKSQSVRFTLLASVSVLLVVNFAFAELNMRRSTYRLQSVERASFRLPSATAYAAAFLNFRTLAADLAWIQTVVDYGSNMSTKRRPPHLEHNAQVVQTLDPRFRRIYEWYPSVYLAHAAHGASFEELDRLNAFIDRGIAHYPLDPELPYSAGLNYIGYSVKRPVDKRILEIERGIEYMKRAASLPGAPAQASAVASYFLRRKRALAGEESEGDHEAEIAFLAQMYLFARDEARREQLLQELERRGGDSQKIVERARADLEALRNAHEREGLSYVPLDLFLTLSATEKADD